MGLFGKKEKKEGMMKKPGNNVPELPELPKLPELPPMHELSHEDEHLPQLPTFPNNSLGNKFSQNTIKEAVAGKKEEKEDFETDDFPEQHGGMMQKPLKKSFSQEYENYQDRQPPKLVKKSFTQNYDENGMPQKSFAEEEEEEPEVEEEEERLPTPKMAKPARTKEVTQEFAVKTYMTKKAEPVFIRIDKFEESMKVFHTIRSQISEIETLIKNTKDIKAKEEQELASWEKEIQKIKNEIEKVDNEIFSRVE